MREKRKKGKKEKREGGFPEDSANDCFSSCSWNILYGFNKGSNI